MRQVINALQKLILENPANWEELLEQKQIRVKDDEHFYIFTYEMSADFSDEVVRDCRGIILDKSDFSIVSYPFSKFCNYSEDYHDDIDWSTARVQDKVDGSIIKLWFNRYTDEWQWSTNGVIDARSSDCNSAFSKTFYDLIVKTDNYKDINFDNLDKDKTYIFELTGPENQIVVRYNTPHLYHIGTRNNITGQESNDDLGIEKPKEYSLHTLEDCIKAAEALNSEKRVDYEGFVVVDGNWHRIKIKSPSYLMLHHLANNGILLRSKEKIIEVLKSDDFDRTTILDQYPEYEKIFNFYTSEMERVEKEVEEFINYVRGLDAEGKTRKDIALTIKGAKYMDYGFKALSNKDVTAKSLLENAPKSKYLSLINDYQQ